MREIIIPKNDDFRTVFNPVILITVSVVLNTIFQIKTSEEVWNSFNIFNFNPDNNVL
ncbi:oligosaccharide repeat unit polymerase, partial [Salmonella enterica]|nr:oligosaccharide repeat unit polymerase [Salmonella enterica]